MSDKTLSKNNKFSSFASTHANLAYEALGKGKYKKALDYFKKALNSLEKIPLETLEGIKDENLKKLDLEISNLNQIIVEILDKLGSQQFEKGNEIPATEYYKNILSYNTNDWKIYYKVGNNLKKMGNDKSALAFFEKAITLNPDYANFYWLIGDLYAVQFQQPAKALTYFQKYIEMAPPSAQAYYIVGNLCKLADKNGLLDKQIEYLKKALEIEPEFKDAIRALSSAYSDKGEYEKSFEYFHKLFEIGALMEDYFSYACLNIRLGNFQEGFQYYESRFLTKNRPAVYPEINKPKWEGQNISDKTLLIQYEQGFGDSIQFLRYVEQVKPLAKKIIFRTRTKLLDLLKINLSGLDVIGQTLPLEELEFDYHIPLMSIPKIINAQIDNIPLAQGYIKADEKKTEEYKKNFFDNDCFKIGIAWNGTEGGNQRRSIPLELLYPLTKIKNVKVYSFQKGLGSGQLELLPPDVEIVDLGNTFDDFSDTAAAMSNLDLFITSDNGNLNLAGAMGKKTFLLLPKYPDWRWFFDEETTPWYNSVKIFKQSNDNDGWEPVMRRVFKELENLLP